MRLAEIQRFPDEVCQLVGVLHGGGDAETARPVEVDAREGIGQLLVNIRRGSRVVFDDAERSWRRCALRRLLRDEEKVVQLRPRHCVVNDRPDFRIAHPAACVGGEETSVDPLAYDDEGYRGHPAEPHTLFGFPAGILREEIQKHV